jgi:hypothetical protein
MYEIILCIDNKTTNCCNTNENFQLWHRRFGHLNEKYMHKLENLVDNLKLSKTTTNFSKPCETCIMSKQTRKPFTGT